jgi:hypothetical protein
MVDSPKCFNPSISLSWMQSVVEGSPAPDLKLLVCIPFSKTWRKNQDLSAWCVCPESNEGTLHNSCRAEIIRCTPRATGAVSVQCIRGYVFNIMIGWFGLLPQAFKGSNEHTFCPDQTVYYAVDTLQLQHRVQKKDWKSPTCAYPELNGDWLTDWLTEVLLVAVPGHNGYAAVL